MGDFAGAGEFLLALGVLGVEPGVEEVGKVFLGRLLPVGFGVVLGTDDG